MQIIQVTATACILVALYTAPLVDTSSGERLRDVIANVPEREAGQAGLGVASKMASSVSIVSNAELSSFG